VDSPKLYSPVPRMSPARESGADSILDSLRTQMSIVVSRHLPMNVCVNVYVVLRHMTIIEIFLMKNGIGKLKYFL
jgi:hypothetical protein